MLPQRYYDVSCMHSLHGGSTLAGYANKEIMSYIEAGRRAGKSDKALTLELQAKTLFGKREYTDEEINIAFDELESEKKFRDAPKRLLMYSVLASASSAVSAYHGYKRNQSIGWALVWGFLGGLAPVITPVIAVAQGFGKPKR